jgi:hypothetical protein
MLQVACLIVVTRCPQSVTENLFFHFEKNLIRNSLMYIRLRSIKEESVCKFFCAALVVTLLFFFVDTVDAQAIGPQASRLIGTIQSDNFTGAVFSDSKGEQTFYRVFDTLPDGSRIVAVRSDSISLKGTNGISYDMYIAHDMIKSPVTNTGVPVKPDVPAESISPGAIQNTNTERPNARVRPRGRHGRAQSDEE